jgi:hypothetical protein
MLAQRPYFPKDKCTSCSKGEKGAKKLLVSKSSHHNPSIPALYAQEELPLMTAHLGDYWELI